MKRICGALIFLFSLGSIAAPGSAAPADSALRASLQRDLNDYLAARAKVEHISAISLSIDLHGPGPNINVTAGHAQYGGEGAGVTPDDLWQIGSNTKAFTAAAILQLEAEGKLRIDQTVGQWLPQYPAWKNVTIHRLLDMTSGIPGYDNVPAMWAPYIRDPKHNYTAADLIAYVYPGKPHAPPPTKGYDYSNTNYLLAELIIERATGHSYASEIEQRFFQKLGLNDTYYSGTIYPADVRDRMVSGYFFSHDADNAALRPILGRDVRNDSVSWMKSAGAIVSTPQDMTIWARALYTGSILRPKQRAELLSIVSTKSGEPIAKTTLSDSRGFGLGVAQMTTPQTGTIWFYEGMTLGYRMVHVYLPQQDVVFAFGLNSQSDSKENQSGKLALTIYDTLHAARKI
ncbi:MAG TPA: serine hydrolase domain-containing protein [Candidatus Cybelea sp.]|nr:serine hydrolase domain-containing protein [Candidatus Cybelea sp.]